MWWIARKSGVRSAFLAATLFAGLLSGVVAVAPAAAQSVLPPLKVVQIGDSYSAGNGARDADGDRDYYGVSECYRSPSNWGEQYVDSLRSSFAVTYVNRACSGGVIADITNDRSFKNAIVGQLVGCPAAEYPEEEYWVRTDGIPFDRCQRRLRPQINAVDSSVDLVLMTAGGNDAEFAKVVEQCFATGYRDPGDCREAVDFARTQLDPIENDLVDTFRALRERMRPDARIVLVTYPYLVPDVDYRLRSLLRTDEYAAGDRIRELGADGDARQRSAVDRANAEAGYDFVVLVDDIKELFEGHLPNPDQTQPRNPDRWLHEFETRVPAEFYHYNPSGHEEIASLLEARGSFGAGGGSFGRTADLDIVFVVDTTGSMGGEIAQVRSDLSALVNQLEVSTNSYRVGVVSYRDFAERTGNPADYPARVDLDFSSDLVAIQGAIDSLSANGGGDFPETVFSGIAAAIDFEWRPGVTKIAIVIGDAPPFSPEPISGLTTGDLIQRSLAVDPVQVIGVNVGSLDSGGPLTEIANGTGGDIVSGTADLTGTISAVLDAAVNQPFAWLGTALVGQTGEPVEFDGSGSFDPSGAPLSLYEWDFDGDGTYDETTTVPTTSHVYFEDFIGYVVLRVTGPGGSALGSARIVVNAEGSVPQGDSEPCEVDELGRSINLDEEGRPNRCLANNLPPADLEGVVAESGSAIAQQIAVLEESVDGLEPKAFANKLREVKNALQVEDDEQACEGLSGIASLARAQSGKKVSESDATAVLEAVASLQTTLGCDP